MSDPSDAELDDLVRAVFGTPEPNSEAQDRARAALRARIKASRHS
jgi:hypothetical protein